MAVNLRSKGFGIILSSPSGGGKSSLARALVKINPGLRLSISTTTRLPRISEIENVDYYFKTKEEFDQLIEQDLLLEYTNIYNNYYGTLKKPVLASLEAGYDLLFDIEWQGARSIKKHMPEIVTVFILPPSLDILKQRLENRQDDHKIIAQRMGRASAEMQNAKEYDYVVVNNNFDSTVNQIDNILTAERAKRSRLDRLDEFLSNC